MHVRTLAFFNETDQQVGESARTATVFVVDPIFAAAIAGILLVIALLLVRHRRRKPTALARRRPPRPVRPHDLAAEGDKQVLVS